ncbi:MAG TPA: cupin domain-containing protein [Candidatus Cybelea sp.]|nr:cupin domain-containing protein [Candidatus Cybelea sp.]
MIYRAARGNDTYERALPETKLKNLLLWLVAASALLAQDREIDATWLYRYVPQRSDAASNLSSASCHFQPIFGEGDAQNRILLSVARFAEVTLDSRGSCQSTLYDREEEIYFVLEGAGVLHYGQGTYAMRANDFTYLPPGVRHSLANGSGRTLRVLVMGFKIPSSIAIGTPSAEPEIVNLDQIREETVEGHPTSVLYKLLLGRRTAKRDAIDEAYVVVSFFWMDFAPGGTNFPHHHETAEEIYLVLDGQGEMVAGSGLDGVEGRYPARAGDAYYFRPNCTVGFYNQDRPGEKAHILAVRSKIPLLEEDD